MYIADAYTIIAFGSTTLVSLGLMTALREIFGSKSGSEVRGKARASLRRTPNVFDETPAVGLFKQIDQKFEQLVLETGLNWTPATAFQWTVIAGIVGGGSALLVAGEPLAGIAGAIGGMMLLLIVLAVLRARRLAAIRDQLPQVLEMLARGTRAGQSTEQALNLVAQEAGEALGKEFQRCVAELQLGRSLDRVLMSLSSRVRLVDMRILTTTLIVQRRAGGHLSETLERMASVVRDRLTAARQMKATTGGGRMSTLVVAGIAPLATIAIYMLHRDHFRLLFEDSLGRMLLLTGIILEVTGLIWVYLLLRQET